ncbi:hypothetical protein EDD22DRAFT_1048932 [Suillus occidentalis]|nr:hypothetical protein EDD22DRAFT_1048932 [Suillus occidentalis]
MPAIRRQYAPVECSICHTVISRKADFSRHMMTHASNKEELKLPCPIPGCGHRTLQKSNLRTHIAGHTKNGRRASPRPAAAAHPSVRYISPEASRPAVRARDPPRPSTPETRASSTNSHRTVSSTSLPRSPPAHVVSPRSSPSTPPTASTHQLSPPISSLSTSLRQPSAYLVSFVPEPMAMTDFFPYFNFSSLSQTRISSPPPEPTRMM